MMCLIKEIIMNRMDLLGFRRMGRNWKLGNCTGWKDLWSKSMDLDILLFQLKLLDLKMGLMLLIVLVKFSISELFLIRIMKDGDLRFLIKKNTTFLQKKVSQEVPLFKDF